MTSEEKIEKLEKEVEVLKVQVNDQLFVQVEAHRRWMQDMYEMMLGWTGQKLPDTPKEPPWVQKREEPGVEFQKK